MIGGLLILLAAAAAYSNSFRCPFIFDDSEAIVTNFNVRHLGDPLLAMKAPPQTSVAGRPVVSLSLAVNYAIGELNVAGYHVFNLAIHVLAALLLFGVVRRALAGPRLAERFGPAADGLAFAAALLWALHPVQTESVTYIIQRAESLMGMLYLLTLYCAARAFVSKRSVGWTVCAIAASAIGMATKEVMVTAPVMVFLYDRSFFAGSARAALRRRGLYAGLAASWLVLAAILATGPRSETAGFATPDTPPLAYLGTQFGVLVYYLKIAVWPVNLCLDLGWPLAKSWRDAVLPALLIVPLVVAAKWAVWRNRPIGFVGAWFFLILAPTSSIVPILDAAFEHRVYLSLAAVVFLAALAIHEIARRIARRPQTFFVAVGTVAVVLGGLTYARNRDYQTVYSIWNDVLSKRPGNVRAYLSLGTKHFEDGHIDQATRIFNELLERAPNVAEVHQALALVMFAQGELTGAEAHYRTATELSPTYLQAFNNLGRVLEEQKRTDEAIANYQAALRLDPNYTEAHKNLGRVYSRLDRREQAIAHFRAALRMRPEWPRVQNNLGNELAKSDRLPEALAHLDEALRLTPDLADAHNNRGIVLAKMGRMDESIAAFERAVQLRPSRARYHVNLGNAYFVMGRPKDAEKEFRVALDLDPAFLPARQALRRVTASAPTTQRARP